MRYAAFGLWGTDGGGNQALAVTAATATMIKETIYTVAVFLLAGCNSPMQEQQARETKERKAEHDASHQPYYHGLIEEYGLVLAQDPHNLAATIALANAFYDTGKWKEAIAYYERALAMEPDDPDIRTDLGTSYRNSGRPDRAIEEYRKVLKNHPWHADARYNLGVVYAYDKKDYASAVREWEELLRLDPEFSQADMVRQAIKSFKTEMGGKGAS